MSEDRTPAGSRHVESEGHVGLDALTDEMLPALIARLRASRLAEIEVGGDGWRVRVRRATSSGPAVQAAVTAALTNRSAAPPASDSHVARSPGVGYFQPSASLDVGTSIQLGDQLGSVDVLGIALDVSATTGGIISRVLVEDGQAVEYGQALVEIEPLTALPDARDLVAS